MIARTKRKELIREGQLRNMTTTELLRWADSQPNLSPLEYELMTRLSIVTPVEIRRVRNG